LFLFLYVRVSTRCPHECRLHRSEMLIIWRLDVSVHSKFQCTSGVPSLSMNAGNPRETVPGQRSSRTRVSLWLILLASSHASFLSLQQRASETHTAAAFVVCVPWCSNLYLFFFPGLDWLCLEHVDCSSRDVLVHWLSCSMALTARLACMSHWILCVSSAPYYVHHSAGSGAEAWDEETFLRNAN